jgi:hypothetical protein
MKESAPDQQENLRILWDMSHSVKPITHALITACSAAKSFFLSIHFEPLKERTDCCESTPRLILKQ